MLRVILVAAALTSVFSSELKGQRAPRELAIIGDTVEIAPNPRYLSDGLGRAIFGSDYRDIWAIPVKVPVLDIGTFAGGLTPLKRGGFGQTTSLHMRGADGVRYVFRSIDKSPERGLPDELKETFVADVIRDQISSQHPYASLVVPDLMNAVDILHVTPELFIMPDDPRLGEFQDDYAGLFGAIEERPNEGPDGEPGFAGADKVKSSESMYDDLEKDGRERVNDIAFLQARLMDIYLGDRDRHFDQWRWARFDRDDGSRDWYPVPKDRDQAFKVNDGLMMWGIRMRQRQYVSFGEGYPNIEGASYNGRELDRRLLVGLERSDWDSAAVDIQNRLTDSVIVGAVNNLPDEIFAASGERMIRELKSRRDLLPEMARDYYELLARVVDLHSSDDPDVATVTHLLDGRIHINIRTQSGYPYFDRTFLPDETKEIRILTHGGDDSLRVVGSPGSAIKLRVLPGGGDDVLIDETTTGTGGKTRWYDHRGDNILLLGDNAQLDEGKPYQKHPDELFVPPHPEDTEARKAQTYGQYWYSVGSAGYAPDFGAIIGLGAFTIKHGFRKQPYRYKWSFEGVITTSARSKILTRFDAPDFGRDWESHIYAHWSRIQTIRFNGFGNETELDSTRSSDYYKTKSTELTGSIFFTRHLAKNLALDFGPVFTWAHDESEDESFVDDNASDLLGARDNLVLVGGGASITFDTRDNVGAARHGVFVNLQARGVPDVLGADSVGGYAQVFGQAATYFSLDNAPLAPTLALRVGGAAVTGDYPYYRAAFLGGMRSIRGLRENRYAGDAMAFGNAELRLHLLSFPLIFPWDAGIYGFYDGGRVWYDADPDDADTLHTGYGGGLWFSVLKHAQSFRIGLGRGPDETLVYFGAGFHF
jgi:hypothetical protein